MWDGAGDVDLRRHRNGVGVGEHVGGPFMCCGTRQGNGSRDGDMGTMDADYCEILWDADSPGTIK